MERVLIKIGGRAAENRQALVHLAQEMKSLGEQYQFVLVHGGGAAVSAIQKTYGMNPLFVDGKRITSPKEMDLVDMGLSGQMNTYLVRLFGEQGIPAIGLSGADGQLFMGQSLGDYHGKENRTGKVTEVNLKLLQLLEDGGYLPLVCSVSMDEQGRGININADEVALALAMAWKTQNLIFISDIPGIMKDNKVETHMTESKAQQWIQQDIIQGGMIPKIESSLKALHSGVGTIIIGEYTKSGDLFGLLEHKAGTSLVLKD